MFSCLKNKHGLLKIDGSKHCRKTIDIILFMYFQEKCVFQKSGQK